MFTYGEAIKELRILKNLTQKDVEKGTGISTQNLSRWERGEVLPNIDFCVQLANFFGVSIEELIGISNTENNTPIYATIPNISENAINFTKEFEEIISEKNFIDIAMLYKAVSPALRGLMLGYIVGILQSQGVNTQQILRY